MTDNETNRLEHLPDELFLLICRYLTRVEVLNSFANLNSRLSRLMKDFAGIVDLSRMPLLLRSRFTDEIWPSLGHNVRTLRVADIDNDFDESIDYRALFPKLQSVQMLDRFSCKYLFDVRQIEIDAVPVQIEAQNDLINRLLFSSEHSSLQSLRLKSFHGLTLSHRTNDKIRLNLKDLKITVKNNVDFLSLLELLPESIEQVDVEIVYNGELRSRLSTSFTFEKVRQFHVKTSFEDSIGFKEIEDIVLKRFVRLEHLSIETLTRDENYVTGHRWQRFLRKLTFLKRFSCAIRYRFRIDSTDADERQAKQFAREETILNSFSTDFWTDEHRWFIHLYSNRSAQNESPTNVSMKNHSYGKLFVHTIPYSYPSIEVDRHLMQARSTFNRSFVR